MNIVYVMINYELDKSLSAILSLVFDVRKHSMCRQIDTISRAITLVKIVFAPLGKGIFSKRKEFTPLRSIFFDLE